MRRHLHSVQLGVSPATGWTREASAAHIRVTATQILDPLEITREPRWYVVSDMSRVVIEARLLPAGTDLRRAFVAAMLEWIDAGWQLGEFSSGLGHFLCSRVGQGRIVEITSSDPGIISLKR